MRLSRMQNWQRIRSFVLVGGVGFVVEASVLSALIASGWLSPYSGRLVSFPLAVLCTWYLNRRLTFRSNARPASEASRYFVVQTTGALINLATYWLLLSVSAVFYRYPLLPFAAGSAVAMLSNYAFSVRWVFRR